MKGVYQHCGEAHLHRYLAEFDFRYNNRSGLGIEEQSALPKALKGTAASASPIGVLMKPLTLKQKARWIWWKRRRRLNSQ